MLYKHIADPSVIPADPTRMRAHTKQMGITRNEFRRSLPAAVEGGVESAGNGGFAVVDGPRRVSITCREQPDRVLGSLRLPVLRVDFDFDGYSGSQVRAFIDRFDRSFLRMGAG